MALTIYRSSDAGAPVLTMAAGGLIALLDACLRTGYGAKAGAGWTKPFSGSNIACFKQGAGGNNRYIRVWDARGGAADSSQKRSALIRGYENMTGVSTGTGPFPTTSQVGGNGMYAPYRDQYELDNAAQSWIVRATSNWFDVHIDMRPTDYNSGASTYRSLSHFAFGNFQSYKSGDTYNEYIHGGSADLTINNLQTYSIDGDGSLYVTRSDTGAGASQPAAMVPDGLQITPSYYAGGTSSVFSYPARIASTLPMCEFQLICDGEIRGIVPGLWTTLTPIINLGVANTFNGVGALSGRTFEVNGQYGIGSGALILETSDTFTQT